MVNLSILPLNAARLAETLYVDYTHNVSLNSGINGLILFHVMSFAVWGIIFAKDAAFPPKLPIQDREMKETRKSK